MATVQQTHIPKTRDTCPQSLPQRAPLYNHDTDWDACLNLPEMSSTLKTRLYTHNFTIAHTHSFDYIQTHLPTSTTMSTTTTENVAI